jgi:TonB-linked SusC/RagA family outer membrane protein
MPGNYLKGMGRTSALLLLLQMGSSTVMANDAGLQPTAYEQRGGKKEAAGRVALKDILTSFESRYKVHLNYMARITENVQATPPAPKADNERFIDFLNNFLQPLGLKADDGGANQYVIYRDATNVPKAKPVAENAPAPETAKPAEQQPASVTISGVVTDDQDLALPGVTVVVKGTQNGVHTANDGKFTLKNVPENARIVFSYIGFKTQEIALKGATTLNVKLQTDVRSVKDVVITGYQEIRKESFTGTAITVTGDELKRFNPQNILSSLQSFDPSFKIVENNLNGSNPNRLPNINVRGATALPSGPGDVATLSRNSLNNNTNLPTFIMDGYEVSLETIYDLDPNRVASMTLLKDAAATAIYGSRAANGVLVIVTKAPAEGKLAVSYNYELNMQAPDLTTYHPLNAAQKLEYERLAGLYTANGVDDPDELQKLYYAKKLNVVSGVNTDWLAQPVQLGIGHKHSIYLEGGSSTMRYGIDARYQSNEGAMKGSDRKRYSLATTLSYNFKNKVLFRNQFTISQVTGTESPYGNFSDYVRMNPYYPKDSAGHLLQQVDNYNYRDGNNGNASASLAILNPLWDANTGSFNKNQYLEFIDAFSIQWDIVEGLRLKGQVSITKDKGTSDIFQSPFANTYFGTPSDQLENRGQYNYATDDNTQVDANAVMTYFKQRNGHAVNLSAGLNVQTRLDDQKSFAAQGFTNDRFSEIEFARTYISGAPGGGITQERLAGAFASLNYSYQNRFLLDATGRVDGSSKFGSDSRMAPFWAGGLGWNVHNEKWMPHNVISQLKLRGTIGLTGDVSFPAYLANTTYQYYNSNWYSTGVGTVFMNYGNQNLSWQRTLNYDLGFELGLFHDRIYIAPRYYNKLTMDLLTDINVPPSAGYQSYKDNLGEMTNHGFEVNFRANVLRTKKVSVNLTANFVTNINKITKISDALKHYNDLIDQKQQGSDSLAQSPLLRYKEGQSINTIYAVRSRGIDPQSGREIFIKKDGTLTYNYDVKDIAPVGDQTTKIEGFFGGNVSYKNWMMELSFYTKAGGDVYNQTLVDRVENADPRYNVDERVLSDRWKQPGDHAMFKNIADQSITRPTSRFVQRENDLELRSVYLSYDAPASFYKRLSMQNLRIAVIMNDIFRASTIQQERGIDYPFARNITFSLSTRF